MDQKWNWAYLLIKVKLWFDKLQGFTSYCKLLKNSKFYTFITINMELAWCGYDFWSTVGHDLKLYNKRQVDMVPYLSRNIGGSVLLIL